MCGISETSGPGAVRPETTLSQSHSSDTDAASVAALRALVPQSALCGAAFDLVISAGLPLSILHHSFRVYLFAKWLAAKEKSEWADSGLLFVSCITHDIGTSVKHDGPQRFEVEGADAAAELVKSHGHSEVDAHQVWTAIALHTSPGIAERITDLARLVRLGVMIDFRPAARSSLGAIDYGKDVEGQLPRLDIEKILGDAVVEQAKRNPDKAPAASWPGILYKSHLENPEWTGVNRAF
ncbi:hypothetical protein H2200_009243 [Cladophialophora chaetospira]|uniref:HD domain-containing protein n=1 Tax=Cladophialophora chaetospira TaxID=386627 RepID=A0AA38X3S8_9EURO|nr:hypothetical protein H2200_009243 [Cladophialophora chaetospira]